MRRGGPSRSTVEGPVMGLEERAWPGWLHIRNNFERRMIDYYETKQHPITKKMVLDAYKKVNANKGGAGVDGQSLSDFSGDLPGNLYKVWNRLTSGSYFPPVVKEVRIPKKPGGFRGLGIPTVSDRVAQQVVKSYLEPKVDGSFHQDSYGYRPQKGSHQALGKAVSRCGYYSWVVDLDIKGFFDNIDHGLLMKAVQRYTKERWVLMYIERWLKAGVSKAGKIAHRAKGTPQGGVISPLLSNIFLHFVFDKWMQTRHPNMPFERYCDDAIIHCTSLKQAVFIKNAVSRRMGDCKLELNKEKTRIVYCKNAVHKGNHQTTSFDFLGYTFRPLRRPTKSGWKLTYFPVMSQASKKEARRRLKKVVNRRFRGTIKELAQILNPMIRGWYLYYCKYSKWTTRGLWYWLNKKIVAWVAVHRKRSRAKARRWLNNIYKTNPGLFEHWLPALSGRPY